jgi:phosphoenolpyruvate synthase/pyruvate phosphate dikinase
MLDDVKKYVISLSQIDEANANIVGERALLLHEIDKLGIPVPQTFVITTQAFDDFIIGNNLVEFISQRINEINYSNKKSVRRSADEIQKEILKGSIPEILQAPIGKSYSGLGGLFEAFVALRTSPVVPDLNESNFGKPFNIENIKGEEMLFEKVKGLWAELFSEAALIFRASVGYEGSITQPLLVQKMVQAEVSGRIFTVSPADGKADISEIMAVLGLIDILDNEGETVADSYFYNKQTEEILDKKTAPQDKMLVRKGRIKDSNPNTTVSISDMWRNKQKLDDRYILNLGRIGQSLQELYGRALTIEFAFETGKLYITEIGSTDKKPLRSMLKIEEEEKKGNVNEEYNNTNFKGVASVVEDDYTESDLNGPNLVNTPDDPKDDKMANYVAEVNEGEISVGKKAEAVPVRPVLLNKKVEGVTFEDKKIVVEVHAIEKLDKILDGLGFGKGANYGLVQFIYNDTDWLELTGDQILVLDKLPKDHLEQINSARGLVLSETLKEEDLAYIKVPTIHTVKDALKKLNEGEVITIQPETNAVYLGAGKLDGDHVGEKKEFTPVASQSAVIFKDPVVDEKAQTDEIRTSADMWQIFNPSDPKVEKLHADGIFIDMGDYYKSAGLNPEYILGEPELKKEFMDGVVKNIAQVLETIQEKNALMQGSSLTADELSKLKGSENMNYDHKELRGAAKFIANPELLHLELEILDQVRNKEGLRNVWYSIPNVNIVEEQSEVKKIISSFGFRRSSTFKVVSQVSTPLAAISLKALIENDIDGIILDLDRLINAFISGQYHLDESLLRFLLWAVETLSSNKAKAYVINRTEKLDKDVIRALLDGGVENFILPEPELYTFKLLVSGLEVKKIEHVKKRGRKRKKIDYGF